MNRYNLVMIFFLIFVTLNGLDVITTMFGMMNGLGEANPFLTNYYSSFGVVEVLLYKFFFVLFAGLFSFEAYLRSHLHPIFPLAAFGLGIAYYSYVVACNCMLLWKVF